MRLLRFSRTLPLVIICFIALAWRPVAAADDAVANTYVDALLSKMTIEEKIGQLNILTSDWDTTGPSIRENYESDIRKGKVGAIFNAYTAEYTRALQDIAVKETRLGIPLLFGYDVVHGHRTIFPISLGESASWDMEEIEKAARVAAVEASAEGIHWTFAPMVDVSRDPRWGRVSEGSGEDVFLSSEIARARVRGFQGDDLSRPDTILACAKHFAAYGAAQAGRDYHTTDMSLRELHETYLPPFQAAIDEDVQTIMSSFNELNGVPATASPYLLKKVLREDLGFSGFVVSDYTSINELVPHGFAEDEKHAGELSFNAGLDMDMQGSVYQNYLGESLGQGAVDIKDVNRAVKRILLAKYKLGLFEDPYRYSNEARQKTEIYKQAHIDAALSMAKKSLVLLSNKNQTLPLQTSPSNAKKSKKLKVAVVGPLADSKADMIGSWSAAGDRSTKPVTLLHALNERKGDLIKTSYAKGASYEFNDDNRSGFDAAVKIAKKADVIIAALGERWDMTGEAASRTSLTLPGSQRALLEALKLTGKPIVVVLFSGRPNAIEWEVAHTDAVIHAWYPGTFGAYAIVDALFGDYNPSGKLPMTFPRNVGQVPIHYDMKNTGRPYEVNGPEQKYRSRYLSTSNTPLFPFGYGLSYTQFVYSDLALDKNQLSEGGSITASITVTNTGDRDGEEVVQLYIRDRVGSVTRPLKELKQFEKVLVKKGEARKINFTIKPAELAFYRHDMSYGAEKGTFEVHIGGNSQDTLQAVFSLTDDIILHTKQALNQ